MTITPDELGERGVLRSEKVQHVDLVEGTRGGIRFLSHIDSVYRELSLGVCSLDLILR